MATSERNLIANEEQPDQVNQYRFLCGVKLICFFEWELYLYMYSNVEISM